VTELSLSGDDLERARRAVVRQVNLQVSLPDDYGLVQSEKKGDQSVEYRGTNVQTSIAPIDPIAEQVVAALVGTSGWSAVRSLRGP